MREFEAQKLKTAIKQQLKLKKTKYSDLAEHLECSTPTIKRILGDEDLTLNRLLEILKFLDLTLTELELLADKTKAEPEHFTPKQEDFLVKNKNHFAYLMELFAGLTPTQIAEKYELNQRSTDRYLINLEKQELIKVTGKQKVKPAYKSLPSLKDSPLAKAYCQSFIQTGADFFIKDVGNRIHAQTKPANQEPKRFSMQATDTTPETYRRYMEDQEKVLAEFLKTTTYENKTKPKSELKTAVVLVASTLVDIENPDLNSFRTVFGKIVNI